MYYVITLKVHEKCLNIEKAWENPSLNVQVDTCTQIIYIL